MFEKIKNDHFFLVVFFSAWLGFSLAMAICETWYDPGGFHAEGYKEGQVDALSGNKIQYELIEQKDKTKIWEEIKKD